jgi:DnaK suppressor protein
MAAKKTTAVLADKPDATAAKPRSSATATAKKAASAAAAKLAVREGETAWTAAEVAEVLTTLEADVARLQVEISTAETEIGNLLRQGGEGAGNDQADVGSSTFERDHEMSMAKNARVNLELVESAVERIKNGTYGICESCGQPVGKMRLQAFPRATLCMQCKQREERR